MQVGEILKAKGGKAVTVGPDDIIKTASSRIAQMRKGLACVCDEAQLGLDEMRRYVSCVGYH